MTPQAQQIAIVRACGWKPTGLHESDHSYPAFRFVMPESGYWVGDPTGDLNAMHEAEKACILNNFKVFSGDTSIEQEYRRRVGAFSSASERAQHFLEVLSLWDDNK